MLYLLYFTSHIVTVSDSQYSAPSIVRGWAEEAIFHIVWQEKLTSVKMVFDVKLFKNGRFMIGGCVTLLSCWNILVDGHQLLLFKSCRSAFRTLLNCNTPWMNKIYGWFVNHEWPLWTNHLMAHHTVNCRNSPINISICHLCTMTVCVSLCW